MPQRKSDLRQTDFVDRDRGVNTLDRDLIDEADITDVRGVGEPLIADDPVWLRMVFGDPEELVDSIADHRVVSLRVFRAQLTGNRIDKAKGHRSAIPDVPARKPARSPVPIPASRKAAPRLSNTHFRG